MGKYLMEIFSKAHIEGTFLSQLSSRLIELFLHFLFVSFFSFLYFPLVGFPGLLMGDLKSKDIHHPAETSLRVVTYLSFFGNEDAFVWLYLHSI